MLTNEEILEKMNNDSSFGSISTLHGRDFTRALENKRNQIFLKTILLEFGLDYDLEDCSQRDIINQVTGQLIQEYQSTANHERKASIKAALYGILEPLCNVISLRVQRDRKKQGKGIDDKVYWEDEVQLAIERHLIGGEFYSRGENDKEYEYNSWLDSYDSSVQIVKGKKNTFIGYFKAKLYQELDGRANRYNEHRALSLAREIGTSEKESFTIGDLFEKENASKRKRVSQELDLAIQDLEKSPNIVSVVEKSLLKKFQEEFSFDLEAFGLKELLDEVIMRRNKVLKNSGKAYNYFVNENISTIKMKHNRKAIEDKLLYYLYWFFVASFKSDFYDLPIDISVEISPLDFNNSKQSDVAKLREIFRKEIRKKAGLELSKLILELNQLYRLHFSFEKNDCQEDFLSQLRERISLENRLEMQMVVDVIHPITTEASNSVHKINEELKKDKVGTEYKNYHEFLSALKRIEEKSRNGD